MCKGGIRLKENVFRYLKEYGNFSFNDMPFTPVDALIFSGLSYLKMSGIVPGFENRSGITWEDIAVHPKLNQLFTDPLYGDQHRALFFAVKKCRRYRNVRIAFFSECFCQDEETQFAAVSFLLGDTSVFVSFRGTDETMVGWKEDFNMGYMESVPAQRRALAYLKGVARYTDGRIIIGGHSKGGNLAVFAAARSPISIQQRIRRVYSFDGPGFPPKFYEKTGFIGIEEKLCKIVPEQSLIGLLFANYRSFWVVESYKNGILQHDLYQWKIRSGKFVCKKYIYRGVKKKSQHINQWMDSLNRRQISSFVNLFYTMLRASKIDTIDQLIKRPLFSLGKMFHYFLRLDGKSRRLIHQVFRAFAVK